MSRLSKWFDMQFRLAEAEARIVQLRNQRDDYGESYQAVSQRLGDAEAKVAKMILMRDPATLDKATLRVAEKIEDIFVQGGFSRAKRLQHVQIKIIGAVQEALKGEGDYDLGWRKP